MRSSLWAVFFTFFVDNLSWAIVFPIFAPYFLDVNNEHFSPDVSVGVRTMILGFFLMAFSLGQFLGAPLIGEYADKMGRKKALAVSVLVTFFALVVSSWSMQQGFFIPLFFARVVTGFFASSTSVCLSCISDLSLDREEKGKNFGFLSSIAGFAFLTGAFFGGKVADPTISSYFSPNLPLKLAAILTLANFLFIVFGFKETSREIKKEVKFDFFQSFRHIQTALQTGKIKRIYAVYFLFLFSWAIVFQFFPVMTVERFGFTSSNLGDLALFMGVCWVIGSGYINKWLIKRFAPMIILEGCLFGFTLFSFLMLFPKHIYSELAVLAGCVILGGLAWPICTALISDSAPNELQGKVLGLSQSVQSSAMATGPLLGGLVVHISLLAPFFIAALGCLAAFFLYLFFLKDYH